MEIRRYQEGDREAVWTLHKLALRESGADLGDGVWDDDLRQIEAVYFNGKGEFLVGIEDECIVAMGALRYMTDEMAELKRMRVHPDYQRRGYGQSMLRLLEERARQLGYRIVHLDTATVQSAAIALYRKNGYRQLAETREVQGLTQIFFQKDLDIM